MGPAWSSGLIFPQVDEKPEAQGVDSNPSIHSWIVAKMMLDSDSKLSLFLLFSITSHCVLYPCRRHRVYFM